MITYKTIILSKDDAKIAIESIRRARIEAKKVDTELEKVEMELIKQVYPT